MSEIIWKYFKIGRLEIRTNNKGFYFGISYKFKKGWLHDITLSKKGIRYQKLPF